MLSPSYTSEALTTTVDDVESRKETGEEVLIGFDTCNQQECATKQKRLADVLIECK